MMFPIETGGNRERVYGRELILKLKDGAEIPVYGESQQYAAPILGGHHGHYISGYVCQMAQHHGWLSPSGLAWPQNQAIPGDDQVIEDAEVAIEYLTDQIDGAFVRHGEYVPGGARDERVEDEWSFGWHEGEFFVANRAWWTQEEGNDDE